MFLLPTLTVRKTKGRGRGVFATADIAGGTVIGDYLGKVIHTDDSDFSQGLYTLTWGEDEHAVIQADPKEPGIHLINHSCLPNCGMAPLGGRTLYFALRKIFKGEELTIQYFMGEPDEDCSPCTDVCRCGEALCQGTMHNSSYLTDQYDDYEMRVHKGKKIPKPPAYGTIIKPLDRYPTSLADDPVFTLFGSKARPPLARPDRCLPSLKKLRALIREFGRHLKFSSIGLTVAGVRDGYVILEGK